MHVVLSLVPERAEDGHVKERRHHTVVERAIIGVVGAVGPLPEDVNRADHRMASTNQHPISMGTNK